MGKTRNTVLRSFPSVLVLVRGAVPVSKCPPLQGVVYENKAPKENEGLAKMPAKLPSRAATSCPATGPCGKATPTRAGEKNECVRVQLQAYSLTKGKCRDSPGRSLLPRARRPARKRRAAESPKEDRQQALCCQETKWPRGENEKVRPTCEKRSGPLP